MSKQQAILETLLGTAELCGNETIASRVRQDIVEIDHKRQANGYQKLWSAAFESNRQRRNAA